MTVSTAYAPLTYAGNSSTTAFSVTWPFFTGTLVVTSIASTGVETVKTLTTHYTVSGGTGATGLPATGTVTMLTAPATGTTLRIERVTGLTQGSTWGESDAFPQKTFEAALDRLTLIAQEGNAGGADEVTGDVMQLNTAGATDYWDAESHIISNLATPVASTDAVTKAYADLIEAAVAADAAAAAASAAAASVSASSASTSATNADVSEAGALNYYNLSVANYVQPNSTIAYQHILLDGIEGSFNGATTAFNLLSGAVAFTPESAAQLIVHLNGVYQEPGAAYSVATNVITFTTAPATGDDCIILALKTAVSATDIVFTPAGGIAATTVQAAIEEVVSDSSTAYQPKDASLTAYAALTTAADKYVYYSGADTPVAGDITAFGRSILDDVDAATVRATIGVGLGTGDLVAANNLSDVANASTARTNIGTRTAALDSIAATFNDVLTTFALTVSAAAFTPRDAQGLLVLYNGVVQIPGSAYTVATTNISFTFTPATGDACSIWAVNT